VETIPELSENDTTKTGNVFIPVGGGQNLLYYHPLEGTLFFELTNEKLGVHKMVEPERPK